MKYIIHIKGCDDVTETEIELNDTEFEIIKKFAKASNENSYCGCQPKISIYDEYDKVLSENGNFDRYEVNYEKDLLKKRRMNNMEFNTLHKVTTKNNVHYVLITEDDRYYHSYDTVNWKPITIEEFGEIFITQIERIQKYEKELGIDNSINPIDEGCYEYIEDYINDLLNKKENE